MDEFFTSLLVLGTQFGIFVGVILFVIVFLAFRKRNRDKNITKKFISDYKELSNERKSNLESVITDVFQMNNSVSEEYATLILKKEKEICNNVLQIFSGKDKKLLLQLQDDLNNLTKTYHDLAMVGKTATTSSDEGTDSKDVERLRSENKIIKEDNERLKEDLKKALESIDYLQVQYTDLFEKNQN